MTPVSTRGLAEGLAQDAQTERFQPSALDVLDWVREGDLRFAGFLPERLRDPRISQLQNLLSPIGERQ